MSLEGPQLFDQAIVQFLRPLAGKKRDDLLPSIQKFRAVSPARIDRVRQSHFLRIARIPAIFRQTYLLDSCLPNKWRQWRACFLLARRSRFSHPVPSCWSLVYLSPSQSAYQASMNCKPRPCPPFFHAFSERFDVEEEDHDGLMRWSVLEYV